LYPKAIKFKFYEDGMKFVAIMAMIAVLGFCAICPILIMNKSDVRTFIDRSLNLIVIAVPPALPAAMSCGMVFAIQRLKRCKIFCISPPRVNVAGSVTSFVFDKTGTLTEDGLSD
jgi:P-type E1-E2 ATPase